MSNWDHNGWNYRYNKHPEANQVVLWYDAMFNQIVKFAMPDPDFADPDYTHWMPLPEPPKRIKK